VFLQKTHRIGIEFFGKMKISKIKEHCIKITNVEKKQKTKHEVLPEITENSKHWWKF
jgi:hypothetical protein